MFRYELTATPFVNAAIDTLIAIASAKGDTQQANVLRTLRDKKLPGATIVYDYEATSGEYMFQSSETGTGKGRDGETYVTTSQHCTCKGAEFGRFCWHRATVKALKIVMAAAQACEEEDARPFYRQATTNVAKRTAHAA